MSLGWWEGGACWGPGSSEGGGKEWVEPKAELFLSCPSPAVCPSSPLVQEHDGHAWRRCHPGWRGPRALPALQSELRSHGQGGWALRLALGTPVRVLRATPPHVLCPKTLAFPGVSTFLGASALHSALPQAAGCPRLGREDRDAAPETVPVSRDLSWHGGRWEK